MNSPNVRRRQIVLLLAIACWLPPDLCAQTAARIPTVGMLAASRANAADAIFRAFIDGMRSHGFVEGKNIRYEWRYHEGNPEKMERDARELADARVALIYVVSTPTALAAKKVTSTIPVLFALLGDPVGAGLVRSLAAPRGNITGFSQQTPGVREKRLEILHDIAPGLKRIGVLYDPRQVAIYQTAVSEMEKAGKSLGKELNGFELAAEDRVGEAFLKLEKWKAQAVFVLESVNMYQRRNEIHEQAAKSGLPTITQTAVYAEAGSLFSYGPDYADICRRSADYAARILRGEKPGELPVQQPTKFELVINLKTAKALGLTIPQHVLLRTDRVIE